MSHVPWTDRPSDLKGRLVGAGIVLMAVAVAVGVGWLERDPAERVVKLAFLGVFAAFILVLTWSGTGHVVRVDEGRLRWRIGKDRGDLALADVRELHREQRRQQRVVYVVLGDGGRLDLPPEVDWTGLVDARKARRADLDVRG